MEGVDRGRRRRDGEGSELGGSKFLSARNRIRAVVYGFTPRGDSRGTRTVFYIPTVLSLSLSSVSTLSVPRPAHIRAARLRGTRRRGSVDGLCAEFESSRNKIRALCDGAYGNARARTPTFAHEKAKRIQVERRCVFSGFTCLVAHALSRPCTSVAAMPVCAHIYTHTHV